MLPFQRGEKFLPVIKMVCHTIDQLPCFMPLTGNNNSITRPSPRHSSANRFGAITNHTHLGRKVCCACDDCISDQFRVLGTGVVVGNNYQVRTLGGGRISHVGLYIGNDRFIHAPRTGKNIEITSLSHKYWSSKYAFARRVKKNDSSRFLN